MRFQGKKVLVVGLGESGLAAAVQLTKLNAKVKVVDSGESSSVPKRAELLEEYGIAVRIGEHLLSDLAGQQLIVVSPGVPNHLYLLEEARRRDIPIWSEVELAYRLTRNPIIGITGTNGKTTTALLMGEVFKKAGRKVVVAGNIGFPLVKSLNGAGQEDILIVELSSFQLKNIVHFRPWIAVLLNISPDHIDWHRDFEDYIQAKSNLFLNQKETDFAVINHDDPVVKKLLPKINSHLVPFSKETPLGGGAYVQEGKIFFSQDGEVEVCKLSELKLKGDHNLDNILATAAVSLLAGIPAEDLREILVRFAGLPHRLEFVQKIRGVDYYNDSKATNPDAAIKALNALEDPLILIAGGRNKGNNLQPLAKEIRKKAKAVILFGEAASDIKTYLKGSETAIYEVLSLFQGVKMAEKISQPGDVVLLSPGCASFDMFTNYEERGKVFKEAVLSLEKR